jgi:hypothetical protein
MGGQLLHRPGTMHSLTFVDDGTVWSHVHPRQLDWFRIQRIYDGGGRIQEQKRADGTVSILQFV